MYDNKKEAKFIISFLIRPQVCFMLVKQMVCNLLSKVINQ